MRAWVAVAGLVLAACGEAAEAPETVVVAAETGGGGAAPADALMARGERLWMRCRACHTLEEGKPHSTGPNLWGMYGEAAGAEPGFRYSQALVDSGLVWNAETVDAWLERPSALVPGTSMVFAGLKKKEDREVLDHFLRAKTGADINEETVE